MGLLSSGILTIKIEAVNINSIALERSMFRLHLLAPQYDFGLWSHVWTATDFSNFSKIRLERRRRDSIR